MGGEDCSGIGRVVVGVEYVLIEGDLGLMDGKEFN